MVTSVNAAAAPSSDAATYNVRLDKHLLDLLVDAMRQAGLDPSSITAPGDSRPAASAGSRQNSAAPGQNPDAAPVGKPEAGFVPQFRAATIQDSFGHQWNVNSRYFATRETADWIARKYGTGEIVETEFEGAGGPFAGDQREYQIKLADGRLVNAGILADYFDRMPEDRFPGLADNAIRRQLESEAGQGRGAGR